MSPTDLDRLILRQPRVDDVRRRLTAGEDAGSLALGRTAWPWLLAALRGEMQRPLLAVVPGDEEARLLAADLEALLGRAAVALWPSRGRAPGDRVANVPHLAGLRARARACLHQPRKLVVAGVPALIELVSGPPGPPLRLEVGGEMAPDLLVDALIAGGYERVGQVEERGEVAVRGGLVDIYATTADMPVRVEFFGDEVESLRSFSPFTQRTVRPVERLIAWPARDPEGNGLAAAPLARDLGALGAIRLAPGDHAAAVAEAQEMFSEEAAAGALADERGLAPLRDLPRLDVAVPADAGDAIFDAVEPRFAVRSLDEAEAELSRLARNRMRVVVTFPRGGDLDRAASRLSRLEIDPLPVGELPDPGEVAFSVARLRRGIISRRLGLAVIPEADILRPRRPARARPGAGRQVRSVLELRVGDHVVHEDQGIGRLSGFETREVAGVMRDYMALAFAGSDRLFVPHDQLHKITRYVGADGSAPALSRMGGKAWDRMKARARAAVREMAGELIALYQARSRSRGVALRPDADLLREFELAFPYRETPDQQRAIDAVLEDMERPQPMDRLICGDVGFGKTEIAMRAAFAAAAAGTQVMMLVPTTILAQQHLATFRQRFADFPISVDMVNRFRSPAEVKDVLTRFREGRLDIVIGTHRLLGMDVRPRDLGLVIVDEEQRFGVAQKEAMRQLRLTVDVLAMSATPIPRSLQISLSGLRDISVIETPPPGRRAVATHVGEYDEARAIEAIVREVARGGQAFWVHNRVETIESAAEQVRAMVPELRVVVAHGQMGETKLEDVMMKFVRGDADVLVSTSIIESGIDIPTANTLVVERADTLGLAQLYQLRGRVGRSAATAHAYLFYPDERALSREAAARLRAISDYTELGSGLRIAMRDLEIRGAGNLLGDEQSGHVAAIGFELYMDMLHEAIAEGRGEVPETDVRVEIPVSAHIPADYIGFEAAKIDAHRRIASAPDIEALADLQAELEDRFGELPAPVVALMSLQRIRLRARAAHADRVGVRGGRLTIAPVTLTSAALKDLRAEVDRATYNSAEQTVSAPAPFHPHERLGLAEHLLAVVAGNAGA